MSNHLKRASPEGTQWVLPMVDVDAFIGGAVGKPVGVEKVNAVFADPEYGSAVLYFVDNGVQK